jgi:hypothetical protein
LLFSDVKKNICLKTNKKRILLVVFITLLVYLYFFVFKLAFFPLAIVLMLAVLFFRKEDLFFKELLLPVILISVFEASRAKAYDISQLLNRPLLDDDLIRWEKMLFVFDSETLVEFLQKNLSGIDAGSFIPNWYDYLLFFAYVSVFGFWVFVAALAWKKDIPTFRKYIYGFISLSFFSVIVNIFFPSVPPWYANNIHLLPDVERIFLSTRYFGIDYRFIVDGHGHNDFAAFPSLHAAWSFYGALWGEYILGPKALLLFVFPIFIIFTTWYGGEHYVIDSIFGCALASLAFLIATKDDWWRDVRERVKSKSVDIGC